MAPTFVFAIAGQLLGKLTSPLIQELSLAWGVRDDLRRLKNIISSVQAVLLDAQERQASSHQLRDWLEKLEDALYGAQDVLEEFEIDALRYKVCDWTVLLRKVRREFSRSNRIVFRFKMAHKIKNIKEKFDEIATDKNRFNLIERLDESVIVHREMTHSYVKDEEVIGRDKEREIVIRFLMTTDDKSLSVLPITGLGGMGKTTLAKLIYNDERVKSHFRSRIWVCIPDDFKLEKILLKILKSAGVENCDNLFIDQLQTCLREKLVKCRYLLILDDVWNENYAKWTDLKDLLMCGANGSKIIVTTRNESVASIMATTNLQIELKGLSYEESLSLFFKWAFMSSTDATDYPDLVKIGESIAKNCKGVPLAVRTLGSILYRKTDEIDWINVRDNKIWKSEQNEDAMMSALKLSYFQLPNNLRRCFAFCSIFPKDYGFNSLELPVFWQANGLLQLGENQNAEDVGMMYIKQLWSRGFFQDVLDHGGIVLFKMHDFVHDLALLVARRDFIHMNSQDPLVCFHPKIVRHISFPKDYFRTKETPSWLLEQNKNVHTIAFPEGVGGSKDSFFETWISKFKSLRLLDLGTASFEVLPSFIGCLKHLKCLNLSNNRQLKSIPTFVCELVGLEYLIFNGCLNVEKLPRGLGQLIRLRYLGITTKELYLPEDEIRSLTSLQFFHISNCPNLKLVMSDDAMTYLSGLQSLTIVDCPKMKFVMSDEAMQCLSALHILSFSQCDGLVSLPIRGLRSLTRLKTLSITSCRHFYFMEDTNNNWGGKSIGREEGLHSLQSLSLFGLPKLKSLPFWLLNGANNLKSIGIAYCDSLTNLMPERKPVSLKSLQKLEISNCSKLETLPEGMCSLTSLNEIKITKCPELVSRCQREIGEDWHKIRHVLNIYLDGIKV